MQIHAMTRLAANIFIILMVISCIKCQSFVIHEFGVNATDQQIIIEKHNSLRLSLARGPVGTQPRACNMKRLYYDQKLAEEAQKIANTCKFQHVTVKDSRWYWVGQNLFMSMSTVYSKGASWNSAIQSWFNEYKNYHYPDDSNSKTGHYTQVAWADTQYVGCGFTSYEGSEGYKYQKLYVCNYGPGGNIGGSAPYRTITNGQCGCENLC